MGNICNCFHSENPKTTTLGIQENKQEQHELKNRNLIIQDLIQAKEGTYKVEEYWKNRYCYAKIVRVKDGDTVVGVLYDIDKQELVEFPIRLHHLDAPEMHPDTKTNSKDLVESEKRHAQSCKVILEDLVLDRIVIAKVDGKDLYNRLLASLYVQTQIMPNFDILSKSVISFNSEIKFSNQETLQNLSKQLTDVSQFLLQYTPCYLYEGRNKQKFSDTIKNFQQNQLYTKYFNKVQQQLHF